MCRAVKAVSLQTSVQMGLIHKSLFDSEISTLICLTW